MDVESKPQADDASHSVSLLVADQLASGSPSETIFPAWRFFFSFLFRHTLMTLSIHPWSVIAPLPL